MRRKIKKVLIVSDFSNLNFSYYIQRGLQKNDIEVKGYDPRAVKDPHSGFVGMIDTFRPCMLLYVKDYGLKIEWLSEAKKKGIIIVQWYPDLAIPEWLYPYIKVADIFFTMAEGLVEEFKKFNPNVFWLTQAFEPSFFEIKGITGNDERFFSADVTFVGTLGSNPYYLRRREYLKRVINEGFKFKWWGPRMPRKFSTIPLIFGKLGRSYGGSFIRGEEYAKVAKFSKIFLAFDAVPDIRKSMSARMYTAVGCGAFYMCQHVDGIEDVLEPGKEIITFQSEAEMIDKIRHYLDNDDLRMKIAEAGRERVLKDHTYELRIRQMLGIVEDIA